MAARRGRLSLLLKGAIVLTHAMPGDTAVPGDTAIPGDTAFAACRRLFRGYPLAVRRHYAEFRYGSMVLVCRAGGTPRFSVLIMERDDLFVLRPWDRRDWPRVEIRRGEPVPAGARGLIESSVPVPRDGTLLGWVEQRQVQAILAAYGRLPEPWDDPSGVPGITVLPLACSDPARRPPQAQGLPPAGPLDERRLWKHAALGQLADLSALIGRTAGLALWIPDALGRHRACVIVTERLGSAECWLPAGVYAHQAALREGTPVPAPGQLLALPGVTDLAHGGLQPALR